MFTQDSAEKLARQLESDWNSKELNDFLDYFTMDIEIISSNVQRAMSETGGHLYGKESLEKYWKTTRSKFPYYKYSLHDIEFDDNKLMMRFYNASDESYSNSILFFNEEMKIYKMVISFV